MSNKNKTIDIEKLTRDLIASNLKYIEKNKNDPNPRITQTADFFMADMRNLGYRFNEVRENVKKDTDKKDTDKKDTDKKDTDNLIKKNSKYKKCFLNTVIREIKEEIGLDTCSCELIHHIESEVFFFKKDKSIFREYLEHLLLNHSQELEHSPEIV